MANFIKVTGLYENKDKNGNTYYRGTAMDGKTWWLTFNRTKKGDKYPDAELSYTNPDPNYVRGGGKPAQAVQPVAAVVQPVAPEVPDEDVPF